MNGASRWLEAKAVEEKTKAKAAAKRVRMTLLQVIGGPRPYFGAVGAAVFLCAFFPGCRKDEKPQPPAMPAPARDFSAGLPQQAGTLDGQLAGEVAARVN